MWKPIGGREEKNCFEFSEYSERPIVIGFENGFGFPPSQFSLWKFNYHSPRVTGRSSSSSSKGKEKRIFFLIVAPPRALLAMNEATVILIFTQLAGVAQQSLMITFLVSIHGN